MTAEGLLMTPRRTDTDGFYVSVHGAARLEVAATGVAS